MQHYKDRQPFPDEPPPVNDVAFYNPCVRSMSSKLDPFLTTSIPIDGTVRKLLEYFKFYTSCSPTTWGYNSNTTTVSCAQSHSAIRRSVPASPFVGCAFTLSSGSLLSSLIPATGSNIPERVLEFALSDDMVMICLLSAAATRLHHVEDIQLDNGRKTEFRFNQLAIRLLQTRICDFGEVCSVESVEQLVSGIVHLGGAAFLNGDFDVARLHIKAAVQAAQLKGGVSKLEDPYIIGRLLSVDDLFACNGFRPCYANDEYNPGPLCTLQRSTDLRLQIDENEIMATALLLNDDLMFPTQFRLLIAENLEAQRVRRHLCASISYDALLSDASQLLDWLVMRAMAIRNRLLSLQLSEPKVEALRIVLLMWTDLPFPDNLGSKHMKLCQIFSVKLKRVIEQARGQDIIQEWGPIWERIGFWILMMAFVYSERGSVTHMWCYEEIYQMWLLKGRELGFKSSLDFHELLKDLITLQRQFFCDEPVLREGTEMLAEWVVQRLAVADIQVPALKKPI